ncbi:MAG: DUF2800 domain-containing protein [Selenomonadaceae bacterium]|nr:DUF2800 domain-containing protein [Selenomonadaceae bacterium]MBP3723796.1 DUF2800 domain-containing protein [Selenomonadaceae bacterium]
MSAHALLSPSAAHRWLNCSRAPRLEATIPKKPSVYADEGTLAHSVCEIAAKVRFYQAEATEHQTVIKQLKQNPLWRDEMLRTAELYVTYLTKRAAHYSHIWQPAFEVSVDISDYAPEAFGRCDCLIRCGNGTLIVADYKHGRGVPVSAKENPQMMLYALGALKLYESEYMENIELNIIQPRINYFGKWKCTVKELKEWGESIKPKARIAYEGKGEFNAGKWCRFCRAKGICEATKGGADYGM